MFFSIKDVFVTCLIRKEALINTAIQPNKNIHRAFHPPAAAHMFFSSTHGIFSRMAHMIGNKSQQI